MLTDEEILALFFARSERALTETAERYGQGLKKLACHILNNEADAEESVNDTYLAAWNAIPPTRPAPFGAYLYRIARNLAVTKYHSNTAQKRNSSYDVALDELAGCLAAPAGVEDTVTAHELTAVLNRFLGELDRDHRILFVRRYWYGDAVAELAERFSMSPNTVSARLLRLRKKLRKKLNEEGFFV